MTSRSHPSRRWGPAFVLTALFCAATAAGAATDYRLTILSSSPGYALDINQAGQIVGSLSTGPGGVSSPVLWSSIGAAATSLPLPTHAIGSAQASTINDAGEIYGASTFDFSAGYVNNRPGLPQAAVRWVGGVPEALGPTASIRMSVTELNNAGQAVGSNMDVNGAAYLGQTPYVWTAGVASALLPTGDGVLIPRGINDAGVIVGYGLDYQYRQTTSLRERGVMWASSTAAPVEIPGLLDAYDINNRGQILGSDAQGIVLIDGAQRTLIGASGGQGVDINNRGVVLASDVMSGFVWDQGSIFPLNDALSAEQRAAGWQVLGGAINDEGLIAGWMYNMNTGNVLPVALAPAVPEPATMLLSSLGLVLLSVRARCKRVPVA